MIYVIAHKPLKNCEAVIEKQGYQVLQVGAGEPIPNSLRDNTGDNISEKNPSWCELTGHYWMWKNTSDELVGLIHYRRYFVKHLWHMIDKRLPLALRLMDERSIQKILKRYDLIVAERWNMNGETVLEQWNKSHHSEDMVIIRGAIEKLYPEYLPAFDNVMGRDWWYACNMFIMNRPLFDNYSEFLFSVLFEAEKYVVVSTTSQYQKRVFGFLSERLLNVWIEHNQLNAYEAHVFFNDKC